MYALIIALKLWVHKFNACKIYVECDNTAVMEVLNRGQAKDRVLQKLLHEVAMIQAKNYCEIQLNISPVPKTEFQMRYQDTVHHNRLGIYSTGWHRINNGLGN